MGRDVCTRGGRRKGGRPGFPRYRSLVSRDQSRASNDAESKVEIKEDSMARQDFSF